MRSQKERILNSWKLPKPHWNHLHKPQNHRRFLPFEPERIQLKALAICFFPMSLQSTASKVAECQRAYEDGKLTDEELQQVEIIILLILMEEFEFLYY